MGRVKAWWARGGKGKRGPTVQVVPCEVERVGARRPQLQLQRRRTAHTSTGGAAGSEEPQPRQRRRHSALRWCVCAPVQCNFEMPHVVRGM